MGAVRGSDGRWTTSNDKDGEVSGKPSKQNDIRRIARSTFFAACIFSWILRSLLLTITISSWYLTYCLFQSTFNGDPITLFRDTVQTCLKDDEISCISRLKEAFVLPNDGVAEHWVTFRLSSSGEPGVDPIYQVAFPLIFKNTMMLLLAIALLSILKRYLGSIHKRLMNITDTTKRSPPAILKRKRSAEFFEP